jgi:hypothetical protein
MLRIGDAMKSLQWIPHALTSELKQAHFDLYVQMLSKLRVPAHDDWRYFVTGDGSWFP